MSELHVPSLQHLARNWKKDSDSVAKELVRLAENPPRFNYRPVYSAVHDLLVLGLPYEQVLAGIQRIKRSDVRENLCSLLPLIREHFDGVRPDFCQVLERRYYSVARGFKVPFDPPMIYGIGGNLVFPWFSFWRRNPLAMERLSLFVTLVHEILLEDPDLDQASFHILDFSVPHRSSMRRLVTIDARTIPRVSEERKREMLEIFAVGYFRAVEMLAAKFHSAKTQQSKGPDPDEPFLPGIG